MEMWADYENIYMLDALENLAGTLKGITIIKWRIQSTLEGFRRSERGLHFQQKFVSIFEGT